MQHNITQAQKLQILNFVLPRILRMACLQPHHKFLLKESYNILTDEQIIDIALAASSVDTVDKAALARNIDIFVTTTDLKQTLQSLLDLDEAAMKTD